MQLHSPFISRLLVLCHAAGGLLLAQTPPLQTTGLEIDSSNERTALVRTTGKLASTVDVKVKNTGDRPLLPPFHAVITYTPTNGGDLTKLTMPGALGGLGKDPYQTFFKDLSAAIGGGLAPGAETTFSFTFERPQTLSVSYDVAIHCNRNRDPVAVIGGPYSGQQGVAIPFDASASSDPDGDALTFAWDFGDGSTATGPTPQHTYAANGLFTVVLTVSDDRGAVVSRETQVPVVPPGVFALARTRTLDDNGHPLGEVTISQTGPAGAQTFRSDAVSGFSSLGGAPGDHSWSFARSGYLTSYRKATLSQGQVKVVAFPWLTALSTQRTPLSLLNPTVLESANERVVLTMPPAAFEQVESVAITELGGQTLPLPLPLGWSPMVAFHVDLPGEAAADVAASLKLLQNVAGTQSLAMVRLDEEALVWKTEALLSGSGGDGLAAVLRKPGSYAVVLADTLPAGNPAVAVLGEPLPTGDAPVIAPEVAAVGLVNPGARVASRDPALVTAEATVNFTNGSQPLASGTWFRAEVEETYDLSDGRALKTPDYDATFYAYQHPGDALPVTATAKFPLRPRILFGPEELTEAHIKVDVLALSQFSGGILAPDGGSLALGGVRISVPAGAVAGPAAAEIRLLPTANLGRFLGGFEALLGFELNLPALADGSVLKTEFVEKLAPASQFVLAQCVVSGSQSGLQPVLRLRSDAQGVVISNEPASGPRLPGITGSGQFVIVKITEPEALITGLVRKVGGAPLPGAQVRVGGEPWLSLTNGAGTFFTLAKPGERTVIGSDPADGNSGEALASLADAAATANVEIQTALTGPRVIAVTPAGGAQKVSPVTPVVVVFSKALAPATVGANGVVLTKDGEPTAVQAAISLNGAGTAVSLFPTNPLDAGASYRVTVSATLTDRAGHPVEGTLESTFTVLPVANRGDAGQLVIYEPGAAGPTPADRALIDAIPGYEPGTDSEKVVAIGSAGTADPEVPVILVNESTGTTATVLSKPDGSFANFIEATEDDFISAVFVNTNGTRISIPATRQKFDDGRVGLYRQGGILEAEADGSQAQVIVEPQSVATRTVFRLGRVTAAEVLNLIGGTQPEQGKILGGVNFQEEGELTRTYSDLVFPINVADLGLFPGVDPAKATFALTVPRKINGTVVFEIIDGMTFRETGPGKGELVTQSPPFVGLLLREIAALREATGLKDGLKEVSRTIVSGVIGTVLPTGILAVPVIVSEASGTNLHGTVFVQTEPSTGSPEGTQPTRNPLAGAVIRLGPSLGTLLPDVFTAGSYVATSDRDGKYVLRLPSVISKAVAATHRRFPGQTVRTGVANAGLISGTRADFIFLGDPPPAIDIADNSPPEIRISQLSLVATVGEGEDAGLVLDELVTDDLRVVLGTATGPKLESFTSLVGSNPIDLPADERALLEGRLKFNDESGLPSTLHRQWQVQSKRSGRATYTFEASDKVAEGGGTGDTGVNNEAGTTLVRYTVVFTTSAAQPPQDGLPPRVVSFAWPPDAAASVAADAGIDEFAKVARGTPLILRFSRPLTESEVERLFAPAGEDGGAAGESAGPWLTVEGEGARILHFNVSPDRRELTVAYWLSKPGVEKIDFVITDLTVAVANPTAATAGAGAASGLASGQFRHTLAFGAVAEMQTGADATLTGSFGGVVHQGAHVWVLERGMEGGNLLHYKLTKEGTAAKMELQPGDTFQFREGSEEAAGDGRPMDLVLIPGYALRLGDELPKEENYLVVYAGPLQGSDPGAPAAKRAHIFRIDAEGKPEPFLVRGKSPVLSSTTSQLTRGRWDAPFLSYLEIGETTSVSLLTLNGLIVEARDREKRLQDALLTGGTPLLLVPPPRVDGVDLNNDGDFADEAEKSSNRGLEFTWEPLDPNERVVDYDFSADFGLMGAVLRPLAGGDNVFAMVLGGGAGQVDDLTARVSFPHAAKRVKILPRQRLVRPSGSVSEQCAQLFAGTTDQEIVRDIAVVSCVNSNPGTGEGSARSVLVVIDITNPRAPVCLAVANMPLGIGSMNSIVARGDGLLAVSATGGGLFLLDPTLLLVTGPGGETAALRQQIPGLETNVSTFSSGADGLSFANHGTTIRPAISQPTITVLKPRFREGEGALSSSKDIVKTVRNADPNAQVSRWFGLLGSLEPTRLGGNAAIFDEEKPNDPQRHFYVVVEASGLSANALGELPLAAAAVSSTGRVLLPSLDNRAPTFVGDTHITDALVGYAAIKAAHFLAKVDLSGNPAEIAKSVGTQLIKEAKESFLDGGLVAAFREGAPDYDKTLTAHRVSDVPTSPLFNTFVAGPIVLLHRDADKDLVAVGNPLGRVALRASPFFWVGLAPTLGPDAAADPFLAAFASKQADDLEITSAVTPGKIKKIATQAGESLVDPTIVTPGGAILALGQIALQLSTLVDASFERTFEPGHVALVNFGFRRNPVVFVPGMMASRLINPTVEGESGLRWLSLATGARAHAREFLKGIAPEALKERICGIEDNLNARINDLSVDPGGGGVALDTEDILRTVGLGDVIQDLAGDDVMQSVFRAVSAVAEFFGVDLGIVSNLNDPLVRHILNKINKPVYEPLLLYLNGYLGMDEYKNNGRDAALRLDGSPNWKSLQSGPELFVFPYDWRRDNRFNAAKLAKYIELIRVVHPDSPKVDIVCHSMGGLVARNYVLEHSEQVDRFISINSPYLGATKTLNAMKTGDMGELTMSIFVPEPRMRIITRHMPSVHQLLPSRGLIDLGLPVLQENGWDLDGDGVAYENLGYEDYKTALDGGFFRIPADEIDSSCANSSSQERDRLILRTQPKPISGNNQTFHDSSGTAGGQADWSGDSTAVRYTHIVSLQNEPGTMMGLSARPVLVPEELKPDVSLSLPPVDFMDSEERVGNDLVLLPDEAMPIKTDPKKTFRISWMTDVLMGGGDGTVPFLSQVRGFGMSAVDGNRNAPRAMMVPIVNPEPPESPSGDDALAGHNDSMRNPQLWAWVGKALQDEIVAQKQPVLLINGSDGTEKEPLAFQADISNNGDALAPLPGREESVARIVWDMGDGAVLHGETVSHTYTRPGRYTVSCALAYEPGALVDAGRKESMRDVSRRPAFGAVSSMRVVIANQSPQPVIAGPVRVAAGSLLDYRVNMAGRGSEDGRRFEWDFGDGTQVNPGDEFKYAVQHAFLKTGTFTVKVKLFDADGGFSEASKEVTVGLVNEVVAPIDPPGGPSATPPAGDGTTEQLQLTVTGHSADPDDIIIRNDGELVRLGTRVASVDNLKEFFLPGRGFDGDTSQVPAAQTITITRFPRTVARTTIELQGDRARLLARFDHFKVGRPLKCWYHRFEYDAPLFLDSGLVFTIDWDNLPALTTEGVKTVANTQGDFNLMEGAVLTECDDRGPVLNASFDQRGQLARLQADDNQVLAGAPTGEGTDQPEADAKLFVGLPWPPGAPVADPVPGDTAPCHPLEGTQVSRATTREATRDAVPGAAVPEDRAGHPSLPGPNESPKESTDLTTADMLAIQEEVKKTFIEVADTETFKRMVFAPSDLLILEQGSGALLWKATGSSPAAEVARKKVQGVYVKRKSDNDYEIFLPVFKNQDKVFNPDDEDEFKRFGFLAHTPDFMIGDWYFKQPKGEAILAGGGTLDLGPVPAATDVDAYERYLAATDVWIYDVPFVNAAQTATMDPTWDGRIPKGFKPFGDDEKSVFDNPATPAEVISALLAETVKRNKVRKKEFLPDVSFFTVRKEHFFFGQTSLEKPAPFGDDPVGDAGMGRQLLLLKWVLEGAFLPEFGSKFNVGIDDLALRTTIYNRLIRRQSEADFEGFEWGILQQWLTLKDSAHFRVRPRGFTGTDGAALRARERCRQIFGTYLDSHDDKVMKKVGKAAIRTALARLAADPDERAAIFRVDPEEFDNNPDYRSFEHFIADLAKAALVRKPSLMPISTPNDIDLFLGAKLGDQSVLNRIRQSGGGVDGFIFNGQAFLAQVQEDTADTYEDGLGRLLTTGRVVELDTRLRNAMTIDFGFESHGQDRRPGRGELLGLSTRSHDLKYDFVVSLSRNTTASSPGQFRVELDPEPGNALRKITVPELGKPALSFPPDKLTLTVKNENDTAGLVLVRPASDALDGEILDHQIGITDGIPAEANTNRENDKALLESEVLAVPSFNDPKLVPAPGNRIVYRGLRLSNERFATLQRDQLKQGRLSAPYRFFRDATNNPITLQQAKDMLLVEFQQKNASDADAFLPFTDEDFDVMSLDESLAVAHTAHTAPPFPNPDLSPFISTAELIEAPINFALDKTSEVRLLLAIEVPENQGFRFIKTAEPALPGRNLMRRVNEEEGLEIAYLDDLNFVRCHVYHVIPNGAFDSSGPWELSYFDSYGAK